MTALTEQHFERTRRLALELAGIELVERDRALLGRRPAQAGLLFEAMTIARRLLLLLQVPLIALVASGVFMRMQLLEIESRSRFVSQSQNS